jgi:glycosyltransferase involved in cell wall biosynthesis
VRCLAIIAAHNEERLIGACLEHLVTQGVDVYLIDNESTDGTVAVAERFLGRGLVGIETFARRNGTFSLRAQLKRKERLADELDADWLIHQDADEFRISRRGRTLAEELAVADRRGFNAVNFLEFTFVPTQESADHDHPRFRETMRWYYPFLPEFPHRLSAWKRQEAPVQLAWSGGHRVRFPGMRMAPGSLAMRHYLCLSPSHFERKYGERRYDPEELAAGWHRWRVAQPPERVRFPLEAELRTYVSDQRLDSSTPRTHHLLGDY